MPDLEHRVRVLVRVQALRLRAADAVQRRVDVVLQSPSSRKWLRTALTNSFIQTPAQVRAPFALALIGSPARGASSVVADRSGYSQVDT